MFPKFIAVGRRLFLNVIRESHVMAESPSSVLVYNGEGCCEESRRLLLQALESTVDTKQHPVQYITPEEIKEGLWTKNCRMISFGGGYDLGYIAALGTEGTQCIREFVENGGSYLGLCAGAYWASDYIEFDKDGPLEVVGERSLKFYPGECIGPAFLGFQYGLKTGVHAVPIQYKGKLKFNSYIDGGGYFAPSKGKLSTTNSVEVLARFLSLPHKPPAVIRNRVSQGVSILSGVHLEFPVHLLDKDDVYVKSCLPKFYCSEDMRKKVFIDILQQLNVKVANS